MTRARGPRYAQRWWRSYPPLRVCGCHLNLADQLFDIKGLTQKGCDQARPNGITDTWLTGLSRHQDDGWLVPVRVLAKQGQQLKARDPWQIDVEHQQLNLHMAEDLSGCCSIVDDGGAPTLDIVQHRSDQLCDSFVIFDHEDRQRPP